MTDILIQNLAQLLERVRIRLLWRWPCWVLLGGGGAEDYGDAVQEKCRVFMSLLGPLSDGSEGRAVEYYLGVASFLAWASLGG